MNSNHLHILQHALGLNQYGEGKLFRNYYCVVNKSREHRACKAMVKDEVMEEIKNISGRYTVFKVTPKGIELVGRNSQKRADKP